MKTTTLAGLFAVSLIVVGCGHKGGQSGSDSPKPKATTRGIEGAVFVVLKTGQSLNLGDVKIAFVDNRDATLIMCARAKALRHLTELPAKLSNSGMDQLAKSQLLKVNEQSSLE